MNTYDAVVDIAIATLERRIIRMAIGDELATDPAAENGLDGEEAATAELAITESENEEAVVVEDELVSDGDTAQQPKRGDKIRNFFDGYGWFKGSIIDIIKDAPDGKHFRVKYKDGKFEDYILERLRKIKCNSKIPIGDIGYRFVKKFGRDYFSGKVMQVLPGGKRICKYSDGEVKQYSLAQVSYQ